MKMEFFLPRWFVGLEQNAVVWIQLPANIRRTESIKRADVACPSLILNHSVPGVSEGPRS